MINSANPDFKCYLDYRNFKKSDIIKITMDLKVVNNQIISSMSALATLSANKSTSQRYKSYMKKEVTSQISKCKA